MTDEKKNTEMHNTFALSVIFYPNFRPKKNHTHIKLKSQKGKIPFETVWFKPLKCLNDSVMRKSNA